MLDWDHAAAVTDGTLMQGHAGEGLVAVSIVRRRLRRDLLRGCEVHVQKAAAPRELLLPMMIAQKPVIADALQARAGRTCSRKRRMNS